MDAKLIDEVQPSAYISALCSEINYKSSSWCPRGPIRRLHWSGNVFATLSKSDFTFITHTLSRCFKFDREFKLTCSIDLHLESLRQENLALLRGLGFTSINLIANANYFNDYSVSENTPLFDAITAMGFKNIEAIVYCDELKERNRAARGIIDICRRLSPNRIEIRSRGLEKTSANYLPCSEEVFKFLVNSLLRAGYLPLPKLHNNLSFLQTAGSLGEIQSRAPDWKPKRTNALLSLGCAGVSRIGNLFITNTSSITLYESEGRRGVFNTEVEIIPDEVRCSEWLAAHLLEQGGISDEQLSSIDSGTRLRVKKICEDWASRGVLKREAKGYNVNDAQTRRREILARLIVLAAYPSFGEHSYMLFA